MRRWCSASACRRVWCDGGAAAYSSRRFACGVHVPSLLQRQLQPLPRAHTAAAVAAAATTAVWSRRHVSTAPPHTSNTTQQHGEDEHNNNDDDEDDEDDDDDDDDEDDDDVDDMTLDKGWMASDARVHARFERRLHKAQRSVRFAELLLPHNIHKYTTVSEVVLPSGARWTDVGAQGCLWRDTRRTAHSESAFTHAAVRALLTRSPLAQLYTRVYSSSMLPTVLVEDDCVCLLLRARRDAAVDDGAGGHSNEVTKKKEDNNRPDNAAAAKRGDDKDGSVARGRGRGWRGATATTAAVAADRHACHELTELLSVFLVRDDDGNSGREGTATPSSSSSSSSQWHIVTVHSSPCTFIRDVHARWGAFVRGTDAAKEAAATTTTAAAPPQWLSSLHHTVYDCDDVVRVLVHGTRRGLQAAVYDSTAALEQLEQAIFASTAGDAPSSSSPLSASARLRERTQRMAQLHVLTRRAKTYTALLREMRVAYAKLKAAMAADLTPADHTELLLLGSARALAGQLEEHSRSLLLLQFSVAMDEMERHLRTLTIFTTVFVPLDFIASCCSTNFAIFAALEESVAGTAIVVVMLVVAAAVTSRWIRRRER